MERPTKARKPLTSAERELVEKNYKLVYFMIQVLIKKKVITEADEAEMISDGMISIMRCAQLYDPTRPDAAAFSTYVCKTVRLGVFRKLRKKAMEANKYKQLCRELKSMQTAASTEKAEWQGFSEVDTHDEVDLAIRRVKRSDKMARYAGASKDNHKILERLRKGQSSNEMAQRAGISNNAMLCRVKRAQALARQAMGLERFKGRERRRPEEKKQTQNEAYQHAETQRGVA